MILLRDVDLAAGTGGDAFAHRTGDVGPSRAVPFLDEIAAAGCFQAFGAECVNRAFRRDGDVLCGTRTLLPLAVRPLPDFVRGIHDPWITRRIDRDAHTTARTLLP